MSLEYSLYANQNPSRLAGSLFFFGLCAGLCCSVWVGRVRGVCSARAHAMTSHSFRLLRHGTLDSLWSTQTADAQTSCA